MKGIIMSNEVINSSGEDESTMTIPVPDSGTKEGEPDPLSVDQTPEDQNREVETT